MSVQQQQVKQKIDKYRLIVDKAITRVGAKDLTLSVILRNVPIYLAELDIPTMATDGTGIYIHPKFIEEFKDRDELVYGIVHESYHMLMAHPFYLKELSNVVDKLKGTYPEHVVELLKTLAPLLYNVITDAVVNDIVEKYGIKAPPDIVSFSHVHPASVINSLLEPLGIRFDEKFIERLVKEYHTLDALIILLNQIAKKISQIAKQGAPGAVFYQLGVAGIGESMPSADRPCKVKVRIKDQGQERTIDVNVDVVEPNSLAQKHSDRQKISGSDVSRQGYGNVTKEDIEEFANRIMEIAERVSISSAGTTPGGMKRIAKELYRTRMDDVIKRITSYLDRAISSTIEIPTWTQPSRKLPGLKPGYVKYEVPNIVFLVDTSGSITDEVLTYFISAIYDAMKERYDAKGIVIPWDADAYEPIEIHSAEDIKKVVEHLKGGGGTIIRPAVEKALKLTRPSDIVVIMSDWDIFDIKDPETIKLLNSLVDKSLVTVYVSSAHEPPPEIKRRNTLTVYTTPVRAG